MLWNLLIHILAGILGHNIFTVSAFGIEWTLLLAIVNQGIDTLRFHYQFKKSGTLEAQPTKVYYFKLFQFYVGKILAYSTVTQVSAFITRHYIA